jgi:Fur family zinc uptake transcriptional regulator
MWLGCSIEVLRDKGYKITRPRRRVLEVLEHIEKPLSPYEIQKLLLEEGKYLDHVTIYRILELFCALNLVHKVLSLGGFVKCTLGDEEGCHRYMICHGCGALQEFADRALCVRENEVAEKFGFQPEYHLTEFSGLCSNCRK